MYSCRFWGEDFKYEVKFLKKLQKSTQKLAQKCWGCSTLPLHIQNLQKQIFLHSLPKCCERHVSYMYKYGKHVFLQTRVNGLQLFTMFSLF